MPHIQAHQVESVEEDYEEREEAHLLLKVRLIYLSAWKGVCLVVQAH